MGSILSQGGSQVLDSEPRGGQKLTFESGGGQVLDFESGGGHALNSEICARLLQNLYKPQTCVSVGAWTVRYWVTQAPRSPRLSRRGGQVLDCESGGGHGLDSESGG